jgi:hypothetical protein
MGQMNYEGNQEYGQFAFHSFCEKENVHLTVLPKYLKKFTHLPLPFQELRFVPYHTLPSGNNQHNQQVHYDEVLQVLLYLLSSFK